MRLSIGDWQAIDDNIWSKSYLCRTPIARVFRAYRDHADNARAIAQVPRMVKLLEAIEAYQRDGLNRWDWIQGEVNSVLAEIRGK